MSRYDDVDSPDYNDTNVGMGFVESSEERRERHRAEAKAPEHADALDRLESKDAEIARLRALLREVMDEPLEQPSIKYAVVQMNHPLREAIRVALAEKEDKP